MSISLVCGVRGVGKTTVCREVQQLQPTVRYFSLSDLVRDRQPSQDGFGFTEIRSLLQQFAVVPSLLETSGVAQWIGGVLRISGTHYFDGVALGQVICLFADPDLIVERIQDDLQKDRECILECRLLAPQQDVLKAWSVAYAAYRSIPSVLIDASGPSCHSAKAIIEAFSFVEQERRIRRILEEGRRGED